MLIYYWKCEVYNMKAFIEKNYKAGKYTKEDVALQVRKNRITEADYEEIVGEPYQK